MIRFELRPRPQSLAPCAVVGEGPVALRLAVRLADSAELHLLRVVVGEALLVCVGAETSLPWCDGVTYLGSEPGAPGLLLPTTMQTTVAVQLVERALRSAHHVSAGPIALLRNADVVSLQTAASTTSQALLQWATTLQSTTRG
jgi:hypothetical protein